MYKYIANYSQSQIYGFDVNFYEIPGIAKAVIGERRIDFKTLKLKMLNIFVMLPVIPLLWRCNLAEES